MALKGCIFSSENAVVICIPLPRSKNNGNDRRSVVAVIIFFLFKLREDKASELFSDAVKGVIY